MFVNRAWVVNIGIYIELAQEHLPIAQLPTSGGGDNGSAMEAQVTLADRQLALPVYSFSQPLDEYNEFLTCHMLA